MSKVSYARNPEPKKKSVACADSKLNYAQTDPQPKKTLYKRNYAQNEQTICAKKRQKIHCAKCICRKYQSVELKNKACIK